MSEREPSRLSDGLAGGVGERGGGERGRLSDRLAGGTSRAGDLGLAVDLSADIVGSGLCDHERLATLPLLSGLRYFRDEIDAHFERGICPAGVCRPISLAAAAAIAGR